MGASSVGARGPANGFKMMGHAQAGGPVGAYARCIDPLSDRANTNCDSRQPAGTLYMEDTLSAFQIALVHTVAR
jgi:hypothetical protein